MIRFRFPLPMQLLVIAVFVLLFGASMPFWLVRSIFTVSVLFKTFLLALLPFLIFSYVVTGILALRKNAPLILAVLLTMVCISNCIVGITSYFICTSLMPLLLQQGAAVATMESFWGIEPYFIINISPFVPSEQALLAALFIGIALTWYPIRTAEIALSRAKKSIDFIIKHCLMPFLPLYVFGFLLKIQDEGLLEQVVGDYSRTFLLMIVLQWILLGLWYVISQSGSFTAARKKIATALPSYMAALSTMSSTATIPVTLDVAEKNDVHEGLSHVAVPILANVHLLGDAVSIPCLALVTHALFFGTVPNFFQYFAFLGYFVVSMLAVAGIPGGGIMVMIPVLQSMMHFSPDMISLITALYLMQDPFGTAANVMGDGALVMMIEKVARRLRLLD